jgi:hypothetical protein
LDTLDSLRLYSVTNSVKSFENLETYSHCVNCFYFEDYFEDLEKGYFSAIAAEKFLESIEIAKFAKTF